MTGLGPRAPASKGRVDPRVLDPPSARDVEGLGLSLIVRPPDPP